MFQPISGFCIVRCSACTLNHLQVLRAPYILWFEPSSVTRSYLLFVQVCLKNSNLYNSDDVWATEPCLSTELRLNNSESALARTLLLPQTGPSYPDAPISGYGPSTLPPNINGCQFIREAELLQGLKLHLGKALCAKRTAHVLPERKGACLELKQRHVDAEARKQ